MAKIYLAGSFKPWKDYNDWRDYLIEEVNNHEFINPKTDTDQLCIATFTHGDVENLKLSDIILGFTPRGSLPSPGMSSEIGGAHILRKVILYVEENPIPYPIHLGYAKRFFTSLDTAAEYLKHLKSIEEADEFEAIYAVMKKCNNLKWEPK